MVSSGGMETVASEQRMRQFVLDYAARVGEEIACAHALHGAVRPEYVIAVFGLQCRFPQVFAAESAPSVDAAVCGCDVAEQHLCVSEPF